MKNKKINHNLHPTELQSCIQVANQQNITIRMSIELIKAYVYDVTGKVLPPNIAPNPRDKFEKAIDISARYFIMVGNYENYQTNAFERTENQFQQVVVNGEEIDINNISEDMKKKMRDLGITGL